MPMTDLDLPAGAQLAHEIDVIETKNHDVVVDATIRARIEIADSGAATFQSHDDVFASSKERLLARLSGVEDA